MNAITRAAFYNRLQHLLRTHSNESGSPYKGNDSDTYNMHAISKDAETLADAFIELQYKLNNKDVG